ncbi:hypothetical protein BJ546DRAFT_980559 [Cryomyces antarcticus]
MARGKRAERAVSETPAAPRRTTRSRVNAPDAEPLVEKLATPKRKATKKPKEQPKEKSKTSSTQPSPPTSDVDGAADANDSEDQTEIIDEQAQRLTEQARELSEVKSAMAAMQKQLAAPAAAKSPENSPGFSPTIVRKCHAEDDPAQEPATRRIRLLAQGSLNCGDSQSAENLRTPRRLRMSYMNNMRRESPRPPPGLIDTPHLFDNTDSLKYITGDKARFEQYQKEEEARQKEIEETKKREEQEEARKAKEQEDASAAEESESQLGSDSEDNDEGMQDEETQDATAAEQFTLAAIPEEPQEPATPPSRGWGFQSLLSSVSKVLRRPSTLLSPKAKTSAAATPAANAPAAGTSGTSAPAANAATRRHTARRSTSTRTPARRSSATPVRAPMTAPSKSTLPSNTIRRTTRANQSRRTTMGPQVVPEEKQGTKRKRVKVDDLEIIPRSRPGQSSGTFALLDEYFTYGSDSDEDFVEVDRRLSEIETPASKRRRTSSYLATSSPMSGISYTPAKTLLPPQQLGDPTKPRPYTGSLFADKTDVGYKRGNVFVEATSTTTPPAKSNTTLTNKNKGFHAPSESSFDDENEDDEKENQDHTASTAIAGKGSRATTVEDAVEALEPEKQLQPGTASAPAQPEQQPQAKPTWTQPPPPRPTPSHASLPDTPLTAEPQIPSALRPSTTTATANDAPSSDRVALARSQAERYKPKTASGLRAMSRISTGATDGALTPATTLVADSLDTADLDPAMLNPAGFNEDDDIPFAFPPSTPLPLDATVQTELAHLSALDDPLEHAPRFAFPPATPINMDPAVRAELERVWESEAFERESLEGFRKGLAVFA